MRVLSSSPLSMPLAVTVAAISLVVAACGDDASPDGPTADASTDAITTDVGDAGVDADDVGTDAAPDVAADTAVDTAPDAVDAADASDASDAADAADAADAGPPPRPSCDPLDPSLCAMPWPSSNYLDPDPSRVTGYTLRFAPDALPENGALVPVDGAVHSRFDGYGVSTRILAHVPGVSLDGWATEATIERSMADDSPSLLFAVRDGGLERVPHWVELDENPDDATRRSLILHPAVVLDAATEYVVALRDVVDGSGAAIPSSEAFAALRDGTPLEGEWRAEAFEAMFARLTDAGVDRDTLYLAWSFVTASEDALHGPLDRATALALDSLGEAGAPITIDDVEVRVREDDGSGAPVDANAAFIVRGSFTTPSVVDRHPTIPGYRLHTDESGQVALSEPTEARLRVVIPHRALEEPVGVLVYGHGMFGEATEVQFGHLRRLAEDTGHIMVATDMRGMSADDTTGVVAVVFNLSNMWVIGEGLVQGVVQHHVLVRTARTGLQDVLRAEVDERITIDPDRVQWMGASQGGIFGATVLATSPDLTRGILVVPGANYSVMLQRSINFEPFFDQLALAYDDPLTHPMLLSIAQLWWDLTDPVTYWRRLLHDDGPDGEPRRALLLIAKGDKQVPVVTNEILARTWPELAVMAPYDGERTPWGIEQVAYPHEGTGAILFDFGNPWPTDRGNRPPSDDLPDPHSALSDVEEVSELLDVFLEEGRIIDVCGGDGCVPGPDRGVP